MKKTPDKVGQMALIVVEESKALVIGNDDDRAKAQEIWKILTERKKSIEGAYDDLISSAHAHWKSVLAKKDSFYKPVENEAKFLKLRIGEYDEMKKKERLAEESRLRQEAIESEKERRWIEAENAPEDEREAILNEPINIAPVIIPDETPKGIVFRTLYDFEIVDAEKIPREFLMPDLVKIRKIVTALKDETRIEGIKVFSRRV
jgi:hypothetical protein